MIMNGVEKFLMNNPVRAAIQRWYEAPLLLNMGGKTKDMRVLEIGCGSGVGTDLIFRQFGAAEVYAVDLDPDMVQLARKRLSGYTSKQLTLEVGDATAINAENESFDAVFNFAIIHHVPDWQAAISEIRRVLKPGGRFFFEEVTSHALDKWSYRTFMKHPSENRFSSEEFLRELEHQDIQVGKNFVEKYFGDFIFGVGYRSGTESTLA
jgi:ubiquinone/menaquinone biosynthesis C-methylase UbiE